MLSKVAFLQLMESTRREKQYVLEKIRRAEIEVETETMLLTDASPIHYVPSPPTGTGGGTPNGLR
jgi:hypothetical protein